MWGSGGGEAGFDTERVVSARWMTYGTHHRTMIHAEPLRLGQKSRVQDCVRREGETGSTEERRDECGKKMAGQGTLSDGGGPLREGGKAPGHSMAN